MVTPPLKQHARKAANVTVKHAVNVKHNLHYRVNEAAFLLIVGLLLEPMTSATLATIGVHLHHV